MIMSFSSATFNFSGVGMEQVVIWGLLREYDGQWGKAVKGMKTDMIIINLDDRIWTRKGEEVRTWGWGEDKNIKGFKVLIKEKQYWSWEHRRKTLAQKEVLISKWDG